jgi:hypothetical protein
MLALGSGACRALSGSETAAPPTQAPAPRVTQPVAPASPTVAPTAPPTVAPTATARPTTAPTAAPATGGLSGALGYPAGAIPALQIVAFRFGTETYFTLETAAGQVQYQLDNLPPGSYHVAAYTLGGDGFPAGLAGGYTQAVLCGLAESCTDHSLVDVTVTAGAVTAGVDLRDWLAPLPPRPQPGGPALGAITGRLSYPSEFIPPMRVVAFRISDGQSFQVETQMGDQTYTLPAPAGSYQVVAYVLDYAGLTGLAGGYTQAVPCGLAYDCSDHSLIAVPVTAGSVTAGVDPGDFYAPEGSFPPAP